MASKLTTNDFRNGTINHGQLVDVLDGLGYTAKPSTHGVRYAIGNKSFPLHQSKSTAAYDKQVTNQIYQALKRDGKEKALDKYLTKLNAPQKPTGKGLDDSQVDKNYSYTIDLPSTAAEEPAIETKQDTPAPVKAAQVAPAPAPSQLRQHQKKKHQPSQTPRLK